MRVREIKFFSLIFQHRCPFLPLSRLSFWYKCALPVNRPSALHAINVVVTSTGLSYFFSLLRCSFWSSLLRWLVHFFCRSVLLLTAGPRPLLRRCCSSLLHPQSLQIWMSFETLVSDAYLLGFVRFIDIFFLKFIEMLNFMWTGEWIIAAQTIIWSKKKNKKRMKKKNKR